MFRLRSSTALLGTLSVSLAIGISVRSGTEPDRTAEDPRCLACKLNGPDVGSLYIKTAGYGLGAQWQAIVYGMAVAHRCGMNFGGVDGDDHMAHGINMTFVASVIGFDPSTVFHSSVPPMSKTFKHYDEMNCPIRSRKDENIMLDTPAPQLESHLVSPDRAGEFDEILTPDFMFALRNQVQQDWLQRRSVFKPGSLKVAIHVRRGDIDEEDIRYTPNPWYFGLIDDIKRRWPDADLHLWSYDGNETAFEGFTQRGVTLHLQDSSEASYDSEAEQTLDAWANFIQSDVFVLARSSFGWIPALFNNGCIVYENVLSYSKSWIQISKSEAKALPVFDVDANGQHPLSRCVEDHKRKQLQRREQEP